MIVSSLFHIKFGTLGPASRINASAIRLRTRWTSALARFRDKLRPIEWVLLLIGVVALLMFIYVLWRQPVSRR